MTGKGSIYRFGDIEVEPDAHRVERAGEPVALEPKAFAVLVVLLEEAGRAMGRDELLDRVWGHRHVTPGVLNRVVAQLRKALGDDAEHPRYIQTLHSLGYRCIAEVERIDPDAVAVATQPPHSEASEPPSAPTAQTAAVADVHAHIEAHNPHHTAFHHWRWLAVATTVVVVAAFAWMRYHAPPARSDASIAVLPFTSIGSDRDDRYFAEGLAIEMHDALAGVKGLKVAALLSPETGQNWRDAKQVGDKLGVATVLDASVRRDGGRLRISAHLSDTRTGYVLWSKVYDRQAADVFATQGAIAQEVVRALLGREGGDGGALAKRLAPTTNVAAYSDYLLGLWTLWHSSDENRLDKADSAFASALAKDKDFVRAQAGVCRVEVVRFAYDHDAAAYAKAKAACMRAEQVAPDLADVALAQAELYKAHGDKDEAIAAYARAEVDPAMRPAVYVGMAMIRADEGRRDLAMDYFKRALAISPGDPAVYSYMGYQHYLDNDITAAIQAYKKAVALAPGNTSYWSTLGALYISAGNNEEAEATLEKSIAIKPEYAALSNLGELRYQDGNYAAAAELHRRATMLEPSDYVPWANLGAALLANPATASTATAALRTASERAGTYLKAKPDDQVAVAALAWCEVNLGHTQQARTLLQHSESMGALQQEAALYNAQTFALLGQPNEARKRIEAALKAGLPRTRIETNAVLRRAGLASDAGGVAGEHPDSREGAGSTGG